MSFPRSNSRSPAFEPDMSPHVGPELEREPDLFDLGRAGTEPRACEVLDDLPPQLLCTFLPSEMLISRGGEGRLRAHA